MIRVKLSTLPRSFGAEAIALTSRLVLIVPEREHDAALIAHETEHCAQIAEQGGWAIFWPRYLLSRSFRLECEIDAYQVQLEHQVKTHGPQWREEYLARYSRRLAESYRLGITSEQARALLSHSSTTL
jgi:hypothetical protein